MEPEYIASRIQEIQNNLQQIAKSYGSNFQLKQSRYNQLVSEVTKVKIEPGDKITLYDKQALAIKDATDEMVKDMHEQFEKELLEKNTKLSDSMKQVQSKINAFTQGLVKQQEEKQVLIAKYKVILQHKGPTEGLQQQIRKIEEIIDQYNNELEKLTKDQDEILLQMKEKAEELNLQIQQNAILDLQNKDFILKIDELKQDQVKLMQELQQVSQKLQQDKDKLQPILDKLQQQLNENQDLKNIGSDLQTKLNELNLDMQQKTNELQQKQNEINQIAQDIIDFTQRIQKNEQLIAVLKTDEQQQNELGAIQQEVHDKMDQLKDLKQQYQQQEQLLQQSKQGQQQMEQQLNVLNSQIQQLTNEINNLTNQLQQVENSLNQSQVDNQRLSQELQQKQGQNQGFINEVTRLKQEINDKTAQLQNLQQDSVNKQQLLAASQQSEQDKQQELAQLNSQIQQLQKQIQDVSQEIANLTVASEQSKNINTKLTNDLKKQQAQNQNLANILAQLQKDEQQENDRLKQIINEKKQLEGQLQALQGNLNQEIQKQQSIINGIQNEIKKEEVSKQNLKQQEQQLQADLNKITRDNSPVKDVKDLLDKAQKNNASLQQGLKEIEKTIKDLEKESEQIDKLVVAFKQVLEELADKIRQFIQGPSQISIDQDIIDRFAKVFQFIQNLQQVDTLISAQKELCDIANEIIIASKKERLSLQRLMKDMVIKQKELDDIQQTKIESNIDQSFSMFNALMKAYRSNTTHTYFDSTGLSNDKKKELINQIIDHHNNQQMDSMELMQSLNRTLINITYYQEMIKNDFQSNISREEFDSFQKLNQEAEKIKMQIQQCLYQSIIEFYNYISVFLVPLTVFRSRHMEIANMGENFFQAKIQKMKQHVASLSNIGVDTSKIQDYIKTLSVYIQLLKKQAQEAENRSKQVGQQGKAPAYNIALHPDQDQEELQRETFRWFKNFEKNQITESKANKIASLKQMVDVINKCAQNLKNLPLVSELKKMGVDICQLQQNDANIGVKNLLQGVTRDWAGVPGYLITASPYTYELTQFIFLLVTESLLDPKGLEETFTSEYVRQINTYLISRTVDDEIGIQGKKSLGQAILQNYGAFLYSLKELYETKTSNIDVKKINHVLAQVLNEVGKTKVVSLGRDVNLFKNTYNNLNKFNNLANQLNQQVAQKVGQGSSLNIQVKTGNGRPQRQQVKKSYYKVQNIMGSGLIDQTRVSELIDTLKYIEFLNH